MTTSVRSGCSAWPIQVPLSRASFSGPEMRLRTVLPICSAGASSAAASEARSARTSSGWLAIAVMRRGYPQRRAAQPEGLARRAEKRLPARRGTRPAAHAARSLARVLARERRQAEHDEPAERRDPERVRHARCRRGRAASAPMTKHAPARRVAVSAAVKPPVGPGAGAPRTIAGGALKLPRSASRNSSASDGKSTSPPARITTTSRHHDVVGRRRLLHRQPRQQDRALRERPAADERRDRDRRADPRGLQPPAPDERERRDARPASTPRR